MTPPIPTTEPSDFAAGDSVFWNLTDPNYPPSEGWALTYAFLGPSTFQLGPAEITPDNATDSYQVRVPAATTATKTPGTYRWYRIFTNAGTGERNAEAAVGATVIRTDPANAGNVISDAETQLAAYKSLRDKLVSGGVKSYTIDNRSFTKHDLPYINRMIGIYSRKVRNERASAKDGRPVFGRKIGVRITQPGG